MVKFPTRSLPINQLRQATGDLTITQLWPATILFREATHARPKKIDAALTALISSYVTVASAEAGAEPRFNQCLPANASLSTLKSSSFPALSPLSGTLLCVIRSVTERRASTRKSLHCSHNKNPVHIMWNRSKVVPIHSLQNISKRSSLMLSAQIHKWKTKPSLMTHTITGTHFLY